jgi:hypothetical protein
MTRTILNIMGGILILVGLAGFAMPSLAGAHLSVAHNVVHLVSGALALYFGVKASCSAMRAFCFVFGCVYGLLGVVGLAMGSGSDRMLAIIPGQLELGLADHVIHVLLGVVFVALGFAARPRAATPQSSAASA